MQHLNKSMIKWNRGNSPALKINNKTTLIQQINIVDSRGKDTKSVGMTSGNLDSPTEMSATISFLCLSA